MLSSHLVRRTWFLALLLAASSIVRDAYDWLVPTTDFATRSSITTFTGVTILLLAGFIAAWRSDSLVAGIVAGASTALVASIFSIAGAAILLAFFHDPSTMAAIEGSGGLGEVFTMPLMIIAPGTILGSVGGLAAKAVRVLAPSA